VPLLRWPLPLFGAKHSRTADVSRPLEKQTPCGTRVIYRTVRSGILAGCLSWQFADVTSRVRYVLFIVVWAVCLVVRV